MIKKINVLSFYDENIYDKQFQTANVGAYFLSVLGKNDFPYTELCIYLSSCVLKNKYTLNSLFDVTGSKMKIDYYFDFYDFSRMTAYEKKKVLINTIYKILSELYAYFNIADALLKLAYGSIIQKGLNFDWVYRDRLLRINKENYVSLNYFTDIDIYKVYEVLYDSNKNEIARRCVFMDHDQIFKISVFKKIDQSKFSYSFNGPLKEFVSSIDLIKHGDSITDYVNTSQFFRK
jgi:hypothetical protein